MWLTPEYQQADFWGTSVLALILFWLENKFNAEVVWDEKYDVTGQQCPKSQCKDLHQSSNQGLAANFLLFMTDVTFPT